jgi:hypothetical protein
MPKMPNIPGLTAIRASRTARDSLAWLKTAGLVVVVLAVALGGAMAVANAAECVASCRAKHNQCRIDTKGTSAACDHQLNQCVQACMATKK